MDVLLHLVLAIVAAVLIIVIVPLILSLGRKSQRAKDEVRRRIR